MRLARDGGAKVLALTDIMGSQATRDADGVIFTRAGLEIEVAATKTFAAQVAVMQLFALKLAGLHGTLEREVVRDLVSDLRSDAPPDRRDGRRDRGAGARDRPALAGRRLSSSTSGATWGCRSASRERLSEGDLTSPRTPTRPAR